MKIKFSLRIYVFSAMIVLGLGIGTLFFSLTTKYFIEGLDTVLRSTMVEVADEIDAEVGTYAELMSFYVTSSWQDMPEFIRSNISPPPNKDVSFVKYVDQPTPFKRPEKAYFSSFVIDKFGNQEYVARTLMPPMLKRFEKTPENRILGMLIFGVSIAVAFITIMMLMMRSINTPIDALSMWIKNLNHKNLNEALPDLRYPELKNFAQAIRSSLTAAQESLDREHTFLRHASHELRTPIAVIGNSTELLKRLNHDATPKQIEVINRIERASLTMKSLTETLLWLSRDGVAPLPKSIIKLDELVASLSQDLSYLLKGKDVEVEYFTEHKEIDLPAEACKIILSNLIRNAFQHTQNGKITIQQTDSLVTITNTYEEHTNKDELGFGLGLHLCKQLAEHFSWQLGIETNSNEHIVRIMFHEN